MALDAPRNPARGGQALDFLDLPKPGTRLRGLRVRSGAKKNRARWPCFWDGNGLLAGAHIQAKHSDKVRKNARLRDGRGDCAHPPLKGGDFFSFPVSEAFSAPCAFELEIIKGATGV